MAIAAACAARSPEPLETYGGGDRTSAIDAQRVRAEEDSQDRALENLRLASMASATGDLTLAETALRRSVATMTTFQADGEFAATLGAEANKEWKGEPYEKMAAFLTLGTLLYGSADHGNALAMFKSAILADTGTAEERFRSDFVPAWVMQALTYQAEGEQDNAEQFMGRGVDALWSRTTLGLLTEALAATTVPGRDAGRVDSARLILLSAMSAGVTAQPRDPSLAVKATLSIATDLARIQQDKPKKERLPALQGMSASDFRAASEEMGALSEAWATRVAAIPDPEFGKMAAFEARLQALLAEPPNVVLLIEQGQGPRKIREGQYGELLQVVPSGRTTPPPRVQIDQVPADALWLDSLTYQGTTRGGRKVDGFLKGKAVYKDTSMITGYVLLEVADALAHTTDNSELTAIFAAVGCLLMISSAATNPAADVRQWEYLPETYHLVAGSWEPGEHGLEIDGKHYTLVVPASGQVVATIPALAPRGGARIEPRGGS